ncbi:MAG: AAA family ATPase, partial [Cyanobacteria bacterium]|nr:AAA family ATPase [Cyanobacteriota bacterium]MDW8201684.1 AAA family ATPase [Cyanobacteriota bacterium SKYGB_h_bin112]
MKAVAIVGTVSQVGKSLLVTALCRLLFRQGWRVTPFKAQSLATTSYITVSGIEIDYAQAVQAWAAGTVPRAEMNPVVLKPQDSQHVEVIFKGKSIGVCSLEDYTKRYTEQSWQVVTLALQQLAEEFDIVVCEGLGNPVETALQPWDVSNMRVAKYLGAPTVLVVSADRGG